MALTVSTVLPILGPAKHSQLASFSSSSFQYTVKEKGNILAWLMLLLKFFKLSAFSYSIFY